MREAEERLHARPTVTARLDLPRLALVALLFALYAALGLRGYGNDNDTYHMLNTWNVLRSQGVYQPSRNTGYLVPEMAIGLCSSIGGHVFSNLVISMLAAVVLWLLFGAVQRHVDRTTAALATLALGLHPLWIVASSTSMDYLYSLSLFALGVWALERQRPLAAAALFALSISARITFAVAVLAVHAAGIIVYRADRARRRALLLSLLGAAGLACLLFAPAFFAAGKSIGFLNIAEAQPFNLMRAAANDALKQLAFWGVPALALVGLYLMIYGGRLGRLVDGGWFTTLTVQVRQNGTWVDVSGLISTPVYPANDGVHYETYVLDFTPTSGDGIRIYGAPGGSADFISVGELRVFGVPAPTPTPPLGDLTQSGSIIARVPNATGSGNHDLEVIRDGRQPAVGTVNTSWQYDTWGREEHRQRGLDRLRLRHAADLHAPAVPVVILSNLVETFLRCERARRAARRPAPGRL